MKKIIFLILCLVFFSIGISAQPKKKTIKTNNSPQTAPTSSLESEILKELNTLRANPQSYIQYLEEMKKSFTGKFFKNSDGASVATVEGIAAVDETIDFLKKHASVSAFVFSKGLTKAANQHLQDMVKNGFFSHRGTDQSMPLDRVGRYGTTVSVSENMTEGSKSAREIILQMLISDGLVNRNQRKNLLDPQLKLIGISTGEGKKGFLCVLVMTNSFEEAKNTGTTRN